MKLNSYRGRSVARRCCSPVVLAHVMHVMHAMRTRFPVIGFSVEIRRNMYQPPSFRKEVRSMDIHSRTETTHTIRLIRWPTNYSTISTTMFNSVLFMSQSHHFEFLRYCNSSIFSFLHSNKPFSCLALGHDAPTLRKRHVDYCTIASLRFLLLSNCGTDRIVRMVEWENKNDIKTSFRMWYSNHASLRLAESKMVLWVWRFDFPRMMMDGSNDFESFRSFLDSQQEANTRSMSTNTSGSKKEKE